MKVVVAPAAFKGTLSPLEAARAIETGLRSVDPSLQCDLVPLSDGGDGFLEAMLPALGAERRSVIVRGPVHSPVSASFGLSSGDGTGVIEAAQACGLALLPPDQLDPLGASTGGVGELVAEARQAGARSLLIGAGGSASTDGGSGMARALGYRFLDDKGQELAEGGGSLARLHQIDPSGFDSSWMLIPVRVACDVDNPLLGPSGAARVYAPQKGARPDDVDGLEAGLTRLVEVIRADLGQDVAGLPGAGAAGGLGAGLAAFLGAQLQPGAQLVIETVDFAGRLAGADLMITGEGRLDGQSLRGKAPVVAGRLARKLGVRSVALVGSLGPGWEPTLGDAFDLVDETGQGPTKTPDTTDSPLEFLRAAAARLLRPA